MKTIDIKDIINTIGLNMPIIKKNKKLEILIFEKNIEFPINLFEYEIIPLKISLLHCSKFYLELRSTTDKDTYLVGVYSFKKLTDLTTNPNSLKTELYEHLESSYNHIIFAKKIKQEREQEKKDKQCVKTKKLK